MIERCQLAEPVGNFHVRSNTLAWLRSLSLGAKWIAISHSHEVQANRHEKIKNISRTHEVEENRLILKARRDFKYSLTVALYPRQLIVRGKLS